MVLGEIYLLLKIHNRLHSVPMRPVIFNCVTSTVNVAEFWDNELKLIIQEGLSYIKDSNNFMRKIKDLKDISKTHYLLQPRLQQMLHVAGLRTLREVLDR